MRRPVGVKWVLSFFRWTRIFLPPSCRRCRHPSIRTLDERFVRSVPVGCSRFSRCATCLSTSFHLTMKVGQALDAVTGTRRLGFCFFLPKKILTLCCRRHRCRVAVAQRFVHLSTHPQPMQQDRQLACRGNHGSLLPILPAPLGQFQAPPSQIAVRSKRAQNVVRTLHQQRSQIGIAFLAILSPWACSFTSRSSGSIC